MLAFELWREYKLSIAEIYALFPEMEIIYFDEKILLTDKIDEKHLLKISNNLGWTIKIIKIAKQYLSIDSQSLEWELFEFMQDFFQNKKNNYAINIYGKNIINQKELLLNAKKYFKKNDFSTRFINSNFQNVKSYQIIKEKLIDLKTDFNLIFSHENIYFWNAIFVQDIDSYTKRDFWKQRDMQTGMLPPKLAQIMINLGRNWISKIENWKNYEWKNIKYNSPLIKGDRGIYNENISNNNLSTDSQSSWEWQILKSIPFPLFPIYDPFCWLATILLEWILAWNKEIYWSDINPEMIKKSLKNIEFIKNNFKNNLENYEIIEFDAKNISNSPILKKYKISSIITEWYLWEIFWPKNIDFEKVKNVRKNLSEIYQEFFSWLQKIKFNWNIVISFPFWEIKWKYYYFEEIYEIIKKYCLIKELLPKEIKTSKTWSLLYKRQNQSVWREIFSLKIKN